MEAGVFNVSPQIVAARQELWGTVPDTYTTPANRWRSNEIIEHSVVSQKQTAGKMIGSGLSYAT